MSVAKFIRIAAMLMVVPFISPGQATAGCARASSWGNWQIVSVSSHRCHPAKHHAHKNNNGNRAQAAKRKAIPGVGPKDDAGTWDIDPEKAGSDLGIIRGLNRCLDELERTPHVVTTQKR
jgi:hypothetical protein